MVNTILVTYETESGSTAEVAQTIGETLGEGGAAVDVKPMGDVANLDAYHAVVLGAPMIVGWHRGATRWLAAHQAALSHKPTALFITCLELTRTGTDHVADVPVFADPKLGHAPKQPDKLTIKEKQTTPVRYLGPVLEQAPQVKPVSAAFFGGKLDYSTLGLLATLFVRFIIRGKAGDYRNWDAIRSWAADVRDTLAAG